MTVKQLIKNLSKMPEDASVYIPNANILNGEYKVTSNEIVYCIYWTENNRVTLGTDYKHKM